MGQRAVVRLCIALDAAAAQLRGTEIPQSPQGIEGSFRALGKIVDNILKLNHKLQGDIFSPSKKAGAGEPGGAAGQAPRAAHRSGLARRKPDASRPVSRVLSAASCRATIPLGRRSHAASSNPPGRPARRRAGGFPPRRPYSVLLPVGFAVPPPLPEARWALTPPFHPYPAGASASHAGPCGRRREARGGVGRTAEPQAGRFLFCGTFPGVAPAGRYPAPFLRGARTFLPRRLSTSDGSGRPADWQAKPWRQAEGKSSRGGRTPRLSVRRSAGVRHTSARPSRGTLSRLLRRRRSVSIVEMSAMPSTLAGRKCR